MGDFYQFLLVLGKALWDYLIRENEVHRKSFWNRFITILTLIEQMRQKTDLPFQEMLRRARDRRLGSRDVKALNQRLTSELPTTGAIEIVIVV